jgi:hypothetical protein
LEESRKQLCHAIDRTPHGGVTMHFMQLARFFVADKIVMSGKPSHGLLKQEIIGEMGDLLAGSDILMIIEFDE